MVYRTVSFRCGKCRKRFSTWDEASDCELDHIVSEAIARTQDRIKAAFDKPARPPEGRDEEA